MSVKAAIHAYTREKLNCAQSVLKAFRNRKDITESEIDAARALGGGRAAGGVCGALHAALLLHDGEEKKRSMRENFAARAGSEQCREIRAKKILTCVQCVELAAELIETGRTRT
ncbi:MAG: C-GCAxxG-C-C family (seleno)protein [Geobacteraceae bacterium]|nr:C-GCAxxG-C-C family (seleno)protein [Geobacteraceae bacterium]